VLEKSIAGGSNPPAPPIPAVGFTSATRPPHLRETALADPRTRVGVAEELLRAEGWVFCLLYPVKAGASLERGGAATEKAALKAKRPLLGITVLPLLGTSNNPLFRIALSRYFPVFSLYFPYCSPVLSVLLDKGRQNRLS
jgi:hypothetical protein